MTRLFRPAMLAASAALVLSAGPAPAQQKQSAPAPAADTARNWAAAVGRTDQGHILGNPDAPARLVEFMSYTCSHCADFARTGDTAIRATVVPRGRISYEIRHLLRDPIDLTAALLTHCGAPQRFIVNHEIILRNQEAWLNRAQRATQAQRTRWSFGTNAARFRAIASDLGFYDIMEDRGYTRAELDRCLSDEAKATALAEASKRDVATFDLAGTPSFVLDGRLLDGVYSWEALAPVLEKAS